MQVLDESLTEDQVIETLQNTIHMWTKAWRMSVSYDDAFQEISINVLLAWRGGRRDLAKIGQFARSRLIDAYRSEWGSSNTKRAKFLESIDSLDAILAETDPAGNRTHSSHPATLMEPDPADSIADADEDEWNYRRTLWAVRELADKTTKGGKTTKQSAIARLYYIDGKTGPEVAEELGINLPTVHTHLKNVRDRVRKMLASEAA